MRRVRIAVYAILLIALPISTAFGQGKTTADPNSADSALVKQLSTQNPDKDSRLGQKVTLRLRLKPITTVTDELTSLTGIIFFAGKSTSDWRVREECMTIIAKDTNLSSLMASIAHVMKFKWIRGGKAPNWTYRLVEDATAIAKIEKQAADQKARDAEARKKRLEIALAVSKMTPTQLASIRETEPRLYCDTKSVWILPVSGPELHAGKSS